MKKLIQKIQLDLWTFNLSILLGLGAMANRGRGTHTIGVGGTGKLTVAKTPKFPEHAFFMAGREFDICLRHAQVDARDDTMAVVRSATIRFAGLNEESPLDIFMNTGRTSFFWSARVFWDFMKAKLKAADANTTGGKESWAAYLTKYPLAMRAAQDGTRRAPNSFVDLHYYSQIVTRFQSVDSIEYYARYRLLPASNVPESGLLDEKTLLAPWNAERLPDETRPKNYLREKYKIELPANYLLQIQLHRPQPNDPDETLHSGYIWDESTHPWLDLASVTIDRALTDQETERLKLTIANQPPSLGNLPAYSIDDYNSINHLRVRFYAASRFIRFIGYRLGRFHSGLKM